MERLTLDEAIKYTKEIARANRVEAENYITTTGPYYNANLECANQYEQISMWLKELKSYKDAEEQGLLVRLPIATGTTVYTLASTFDCVYGYNDCKATQKWKCEEDIQCEYEKKSYYVKEIDFCSIMTHSIGKSIFLTREEAEKKLEEMKNDKA